MSTNEENVPEGDNAAQEAQERNTNEVSTSEGFGPGGTEDFDAANPSHTVSPDELGDDDDDDDAPLTQDEDL